MTLTRELLPPFSQKHGGIVGVAITIIKVTAAVFKYVYLNGRKSYSCHFQTSIGEDHEELLPLFSNNCKSMAGVTNSHKRDTPAVFKKSAVEWQELL